MAETDGRICPLNKAANLITRCVKDCALYTGESCSLAQCKADHDTQGLTCPFMRNGWMKCAPACALYNEGCALTTIMKGKKTRPNQ